jgi:phosphatidylserine decarboxylase
MTSIAPEGKPILLATALFAVLCVSAGIVLGGLVATILTLVGLFPLAFSLYFFRDPVRRVPQQIGTVVAAADGKIIEVSLVEPNPVHEHRAWKVSTFMSPLNVHINRIPVGGTVQSLKHHRGLFLAAFESKASLNNERQVIAIESPYGPVGCVQIAGWLARRIVCHLRQGEKVETGQRFGLIRFGSRVDLYLPPECDIKVKPADRVRGGETIIGVFHEAK